MESLPTISDLRKLRWKVRVIPFRNLNQKAEFKSELALVPEYHARFISKVDKLPKGGKIIVEIIPPESNTIFKGVAVNHPKLNFNKKAVKNRALKIALYKAGIRRERKVF